MQSRATRAITKAVVAASTAGAIATACWLLNRILDSCGRYRDHKRIAEYVDTEDTGIDSENECDRYDSEQELDAIVSFALLPVVSESDVESDEDALGYTADYFTPHYDVCMLSVSVQTLVDPLPDIPPRDCRLFRAAESCDASSEDLYLGGKMRTLSFTESDSSDGNVFSLISELDDQDEHEMMQRARAHSRFLAEPAGFPDHPHRGFQTVTYMFPASEGGMLHEDFMGNKGELRAGDLQWMTAGRGIMHAELPSSTKPACGLQLWINLPNKLRMIKPHYQEITGESVPHVFNADKTVEAIVFAGEVFGSKGPIETEAPVTYVHFSLKPGATMEYEIPASHNVFVYGVSGTGKCAGVDVRMSEAIVMEKEGDGVQLVAAKDDTLDVVVMTGEPLGEPVSQYGPFVMSSREEIAQTLWDFDMRTNGFEAAHGWRSELVSSRSRGK